MKKTNSRGFTLIEILIVVAIIGILSSVVLVGLGPVQRRGRDARRIADLKEVQNALELYYSKCGYYPGTAQGAPSGNPSTGGVGGGASVGCSSFSQISSWTDLKTALVGSDLGTKQIPNDPASAATYYYGTSNDGSSYVLGAKLEDSANPALNSDADGTVYGVACDDPIYCVEF